MSDFPATSCSSSSESKSAADDRSEMLLVREDDSGRTDELSVEVRLVFVRSSLEALDGSGGLV